MANSHTVALDKPIGLGRVSDGLKYLPGVLLLFSIGIAAKSIAVFLTSAQYVIFAIAIGAIIVNTSKVPEACKPGVRTYHFWLKVGIVLMGSRIALQDAAHISIAALWIIAAEILLALVSAKLFAKRLRLSDALGSLLGLGIGICGVSAVVAATDVVKSEEEDLADAIATLLSVGAITVFLYPIVGNYLRIPEAIYGYWTGLSMTGTPEAVAAGFALSANAGTIVTVLKLTRNSLLGIVLLIWALRQTKTRMSKPPINKWMFLWHRFPKFIFGCLVLSVLTSLGFFSPQQLAFLQHLSEGALMLAFAGVGMSLELDKMRAGLRPLLAGLAVEAVVSLTTLGLVLLAV